MVDKEHFLVKHREKIIQKTNNPMNLADVLVGKHLIDQETLAKIYAQKTNQEKTRKIYMRLNSKAHFDCMYDWFKNKEPHLFEELENDDTEAEAPQKKRVRFEDEDETDNNLTGFPGKFTSCIPESETDLRTISTFAKLEEWVSKPGISQKMISDLERKLGDEGMAALRKELKVKEPRNSLCFNASNIDDIRKNKELERFLNTTQKAKFPKLTYDIWFKKCASASSGNRAQSSIDFNECMEAMTDLSSSGIESSLNSSLNNSYSVVSFNYLPQNDEGLPDEDCRYTGDMDIMIHENKDKESEFKTPEKLLGGSFIQMDPEVNADAPSQEPVNMQNTHIDEMEEQSQRSYVPNVMRHEDESLHQNEQITEKETPLDDGLGGPFMQETCIDEMDDEPQRSNVPNVMRHEDESLQQNERITKKETPLDVELGSKDFQEIQIDEMDDEPKRSYVPNYPRHEDVSLHQNQSIAKNETPLEDGLGSTDFQDAHIDEMDDESKRSNVPHVPRHEDESLHQNEQITEKETPLDDGLGGTFMRETCIDEMDDEPQRSNVPNGVRHEDESLQQNERITKKETPLEVGLGCTDMQETQIDEIDEEPQRLNVPNVPSHEDINLCQNESITIKETPLEDGLGSTDMQDAQIGEMDDEPKRSYVPNYPRHEDLSLHQNESIIKNKKPLEDGLGSTDMKEQCNNEIDEQLKISNPPRREDESLHQNVQITEKETPLDVGLGCTVMQETQVDETGDGPKRSYVPNVPRHEDVSLHQNETIGKNETPLEDGLGGMFMQETCIDEMEEEPQRSNVLTHAASLHQNESVVKSKIPLEGRCGNMHMQQNEQENMQVKSGPFLSTQLQKNSPGSASEHTESNATESSVLNKDTAILAKNRDVKDRIETSKKRENSKCQKEKKKKEKDKRLHDWALRQCNNREEDLKNIFDQISIINMAQHSDYPCFTAENVMVYKYLTPESQIIFITDDNTSVKTMTTVHYQMFVCKIKRAILLGPKEPHEQEIPYKISQVPIDKCTDFIFKAFAPALTVYKQIQKEEKLYSLI